MRPVILEMILFGVQVLGSDIYAALVVKMTVDGGGTTVISMRMSCFLLRRGDSWLGCKIV